MSQMIANQQPVTEPNPAYSVSRMSSGRTEPTIYKDNESAARYHKSFSEGDDKRCYVCNTLHTLRSNTPNLTMGVDRINSSFNYTKEIDLPACSTCNCAKRDFELVSFIAQRHRISSRKTVILEEVNAIHKKTPTTLEAVPSRETRSLVKRKNRRHVFNSRGKPVLILDSETKEVVAAYPSRAAGCSNIGYATLRKVISHRTKVKGKFIVEDCTREQLDTIVVSTDLYREFISLGKGGQGKNSNETIARQ